MLRRLVVLALFLATTASGAPLELPDVTVVDQEGRSVRFYSDLVKDKTVVMNFIFTSCSTVCSPMGANFAALQKKLGKRSDVQLISISIDPAIDTPERLKKWSRQFKARPGWTLVTGDRKDIDRVLTAVGAQTVNRYEHTPLIIVGSDRSGEWSRASGLATPAVIVDMIDRIKTE